MTLEIFKEELQQAVEDGSLAQGVIGEGVMIPGAKGDVPLVYADYVASGRALRQVEEYIAKQVLPYYANSHTEASFCGAYMTQLRRAARAEIARLTQATGRDAVIFAGAGATAGLNRLVSLFGVNEARNPVVFIGPYEHHSNILPWRESRAKVVEIPEAPEGGLDLQALQQALLDHASSDLIIGSFSAASNVTGILTNPDAISCMIHAVGGLVVWDYAGAGPYVPISMAGGQDAADNQPSLGTHKDAVVISPHKFAGGPGASGVLIVNRDAVRRRSPSWPGGGTVSFVSPWGHDYSTDLAAREEAGTPNVIGDIRAALAFLVKEAVGADEIAAKEARFAAMARAGWGGNPQLTLLGHPSAHRLPIFSFTVRGLSGAPVHQQLFTRMLSDHYGIQARGGCACAGPYAHRLLDIDEAESTALFDALKAGKELQKPGWIRLNFSYLMTEKTAQYIIDSVNDLARRAEELAASYEADPKTARFQPFAA
ncbi:aminotransferase class V-fold PLP-dependent enzyme [Pseudophaeobacter flagellatus]|uniref:aminotransferase class V-fold PLP-dependent enzyme n=1 Tax=Pseudophaeobacter flagellatus TaxID=2899119 RepID=UPI001E4DB499|nr:aminotransferase class V-fold PLP-dependent enzyme [Pseudophaeobacter flagellatus]MCD9149586.1 aminotransferase class V-fold PLP-dependent enzyme [Pseudophaeobacter flagellatus]